ncbi:sensor histidine kinase [Natronococcus wangiae]|uniref:sensor histidine kinase n=1 Tax=Natronococcus wangiae TaxID=3068275 RepID=UPI00273D6924|nr:ATP-binding protein [Natronococcus sp. AD5]
MPHWTRVVSALDGRYAVMALGALYLALAVGWASMQASLGMSRSNILVLAFFISISGLVLLVGGYRLPRSTVHPEFYSTVAKWCFGGLGVMLVMLLLYHVQPTVDIINPDRSALILTGFSSVAGFGVGVYNAQAKTHARQLEAQNWKLQQIQERLAESNERLEQFAYAASHDLQEPLRMVSSYLQLIESRYADEFDEDGKEFLEYAIDGSKRMKEMIDGLLEYSRVDTQGKAFEPTDLEEVLAAVRKDLELQIAESGAEIEIGELPRVRGDASQLRQLFQNLLSNAIEYSGDAPPRITVFADRSGEKWRISVHDEGVGIDRKNQDRIFKVFQRLHSYEEQPGTGIGLALCERIVERHGGEIRVDSEPGEGATFSVTLPPATDRAAEPPSEFP